MPISSFRSWPPFLGHDLLSVTDRVYAPENCPAPVRFDLALLPAVREAKEALRFGRQMETTFVNTYLDCDTCIELWAAFAEGTGQKVASDAIRLHNQEFHPDDVISED